MIVDGATEMDDETGETSEDEEATIGVMTLVETARDEVEITVLRAGQFVT